MNPYLSEEERLLDLRETEPVGAGRIENEKSVQLE